MVPAIEFWIVEASLLFIIGLVGWVMTINRAKKPKTLENVASIWLYHGVPAIASIQLVNGPAALIFFYVTNLGGPTPPPNWVPPH